MYARFHPDDRAAFDRHREQIEKRRLAGEGEWRIVRPDGTWRWVAHACQAVYDKNGSYLGFRSSNREITDRKRAEETLERERNLLRTLIDNLPDYVYVKDAQGRFLASNLAAARILGAATTSEILGRTDADFYPPELAAEYRADEERLLASGQPLLDKDEPHRDSTGNVRTILTTKVPVRDSRGVVVGLVGISRDITERKQAETERQKFVSLADQSTEFIGMCDMNFKPFYINEAGRRTVGLGSLEEALATPVKEFFFPADQGFIYEEFFRACCARAAPR